MNENYIIIVLIVSRDGSVGIATRYGLDGPGIESRWGRRIFRSHTDRPWGLPSLLHNGSRVPFPGIKWPERGVDQPPSYSAKVKKQYSDNSTPRPGIVAFHRENFTFSLLSLLLLLLAMFPTKTCLQSPQCPS